MPLDRRLAALAFVFSILYATAVTAQDSSSSPAGVEALRSGAALVATSCFRCHTDTMFRDQRQDERAWKATIYRMVGRGGLWTQDQIDSMAAYLGSALGPNATSPAPKLKKNTRFEP